MLSRNYGALDAAIVGKEKLVFDCLVENYQSRDPNSTLNILTNGPDDLFRLTQLRVYLYSSFYCQLSAYTDMMSRSGMSDLETSDNETMGECFGSVLGMDLSGCLLGSIHGLGHLEEVDPTDAGFGRVFASEYSTFIANSERVRTVAECVIFASVEDEGLGEFSRAAIKSANLALFGVELHLLNTIKDPLELQFALS
jgi:hypothetical protein